MTHEELEELLPSFALDAVSPAEEMELQMHIETCPSCQDLLVEYRNTAGSLALVPPGIEPPPAISDRLLQEASVGAGQAKARPGRVRWRPPWERIGAAFTTAALLILTVVSVALQHMLLQERRAAAEQLQAISVIESPAGRSVAMEPTRYSPRAAGQVYVDDHTQAAAVVMRGLSDPGAKVYQLWLLEDGRAVPIRSFRPNASGAATVLLESGASPGQRLAVSLEPSMGSQSPRGPQVLRSG